LGTLLLLLENFQFIGFNEGVWICINSMAFVKNIEFWVVFLFEIQLNYKKIILEGKNGQPIHI
jgi:hypothetical protein